MCLLHFQSVAASTDIGCAHAHALRWCVWSLGLRAGLSNVLFRLGSRHPLLSMSHLASQACLLLHFRWSYALLECSHYRLACFASLVTLFCRPVLFWSVPGVGLLFVFQTVVGSAAGWLWSAVQERSLKCSAAYCSCGWGRRVVVGTSLHPWLCVSH